MCPGLGSSNSSTSPSPLISGGSECPSAIAVAVRAKGEGGGLRDFDRRASSWRKGIGENSGVGGAEGCVAPKVIDILAEAAISWAVIGGNASHVDVTKSVFSTARRYFPTDL